MFTALAGAVDTSTTGAKLSRTVPHREVLRSATFNLRTGTAPDVALIVTRGAAVARVLQSTADMQLVMPMQLEPGDVLEWNVITGGAGSTSDFSFTVE